MRPCVGVAARTGSSSTTTAGLTGGGGGADDRFDVTEESTLLSSSESSRTDGSSPSLRIFWATAGLGTPARSILWYLAYLSVSSDPLNKPSAGVTGSRGGEAGASDGRDASVSRSGGGGGLGYDVDGTGKERTLLLWATFGGTHSGEFNERNVALARYLLDRGADVNRRDYRGFTPLHFAEPRLPRPVSAGDRVARPRLLALPITGRHARIGCLWHVLD